MTVESLSKSAWGGLRLGWLRSDPSTIDGLVAARSSVELGVSVPSQLLAVALSAELDAVLAVRRARLVERAAHLRSGLLDRLDGWEADLPDGGLSLWVRLPVADSRPFAAAAARHGVDVLPGTFATPDRRVDPHLRLCVDRPLSQLDLAVERLAAAWRSLGPARRG